MSITVGTDSYITVVEADTILDDFFDADNWENATEANKEKALKQATRNIDAQNLRGAKVEEQTLAFPRSVYFDYDGDEYGVTPNAVKTAQALEALAILDERANPDQSTALQKKGVVSQSIEGTSVTYDSDLVKRKANDKVELLSSEAKSLLRKYIQRTFARR